MTAELLLRNEAIGVVMPKPLLKCLQIVMIILFSLGRDARQPSATRLFLTWSLFQGRLTTSVLLVLFMSGVMLLSLCLFLLEFSLITKCVFETCC